MATGVAPAIPPTPAKSGGVPNTTFSASTISLIIIIPQI
nr:MAG TPA: hypothetical protein [Caudoviricetes sp.]DAN26723.1 MAG TPA: hypothetical protein [Caudoviricetes sp.]DAO98509.1 MAG TPA: hypothetical protein [Caudoviricetes sp.]